MQRPSRAVMTAVLAAWLLSGSVAGLAAQAAAPAPSPSASAGQPAPNSQDQFVPVKTLPRQEQLPAATLVMGAYGFVWAVLLIYVWTVWRRLMKVEREIRTLAERLKEKGA